MSGTVYLVGAGPGDPELITLKAARVLGRADVVLYDRLVNKEILELVNPNAELIDVGKRKNRPCTEQQKMIIELLIEKARSYETVVRLKGGDPFVFGRGGEEILELSRAGIFSCVIPGISAGIAIPGINGIPVTHRGIASNVAFFTGHLAENNEGEEINWNLAAQVDTAVFFMGVKSLKLIVGKLVSSGKLPSTAVAIIENGSCSEEKIIVGTLSDIISRAANLQTPAIIIVGEVVSLRSEILLKDYIEVAPGFRSALCPINYESN